jgi:uncharacterized protein YdeI (YjbR/CyaY-like superfamily)
MQRRADIGVSAMEVTFFDSPAAFRAWLDEHHETAKELWVGFYKKSSGRPSITWPESVDEALCFGWIDGIRKSVDDTSYTIRFTPRKPRSNWSAVNIARVADLTRLGRMRPAGRTAFEQRVAEKPGVYSYEQRHTVQLDDALEQPFRANQPAWDFFQAQPAGYRQMAIWWVVSAKREATRLKRLATLIEDSAQGRRIAVFARPTSKGKV